MPDKVSELINIATDLLVAELKRRAEAKGMTVEELLDKADTNWREAEEIGRRLSERE